jgi:hypothetical protein
LWRHPITEIAESATICKLPVSPAAHIPALLLRRASAACILVVIYKRWLITYSAKEGSAQFSSLNQD